MDFHPCIHMELHCCRVLYTLSGSSDDFGGGEDDHPDSDAGLGCVHERKVEAINFFYMEGKPHNMVC